MLCHLLKNLLDIELLATVVSSFYRELEALVVIYCLLNRTSLFNNREFDLKGSDRVSFLDDLIPE